MIPTGLGRGARCRTAVVDQGAEEYGRECVDIESAGGTSEPATGKPGGDLIDRVDERLAKAVPKSGEPVAVLFEDADDGPLPVELGKQPPSQQECFFAPVLDGQLIDADGGLGEGLQVFFEGGLQQCFFAGKVTIEGPTAGFEPGGGLDLADSGLSKAALGEQPHSCREEPLLGGLTADRFGRPDAGAVQPKVAQALVGIGRGRCPELVDLGTSTATVTLPRLFARRHSSL